MKRRNIPLMPIVCIVVGVIICLAIPGVMKNKQERCTMEVPAVIADVVVNDDDSGPTYAPVYEFVLDGEKTRRTPNYSTGSYPTVGKEVSLFLNPDNTEEFYEPERDGSTSRVLRIVGCFFLGGGLILVFSKPKRR